MAAENERASALRAQGAAASMRPRRMAAENSSRNAGPPAVRALQ